MRTKLIAVTIFLGLLISPGYAHAKVLSKKELRKKLEVKESELNILAKKIIDLETSIISMQQRINEFCQLLLDAKEQKLLEENPHQEINKSDLLKDYFDEMDLYLTSFVNTNDKREQLIIRDSFFKELDTKDASLLKFYLTNFAYANINLNKAIAEWEMLISETTDLYCKLDAIKE